MKCQTCLWGRVATDSVNELDRMIVVTCSKINCPDLKDWVLKQKMEAEEKIKSGDRTMLKKPLIFVCSPLRGQEEKANLAQAARYSRFVARCGAVPITPHLFFTQFLNDKIMDERKQGIDLGLDALARCAQMWVFGYRITTGMHLEINLAKQLKIPILHFDLECKRIPVGELDALIDHQYAESKGEKQTAK